ncbi:MAG: flagellar biosynthesis protein FlgM [Planctomycetes bacterium]|nr:flagellar biosynthesis protein FlgM [Planctomycetota bacterium]
MRWEGRRQSENVEDRRSAGQQAVIGGGLLTLLLMIVMMFLGVDPMHLMRMAPQLGGGPVPAAKAGKPINDDVSKFLKTVLADNEDVWSRIFPRAFGTRFVPTKLVMFTGQVSSRCGIASAGAGPFYCPLDKTVYIDPTFYEELKRRFGAPGDFAQAYVIAHEIGHHVQNQLGIAERVQSMQRRMSQADYNRLSVRMELQAEYLAGVWARHMAQYAGILDEEDIREAVNAAAAIGDDRIQAKAQGYVVPEAFTHGTSEQRVRWFLYGLKTDSPELVVQRMNEAFERDSP